MSATIPTYIYEKLYGDRVKVIDITNVEMVGKVIQNTKRSCSRSSMYAGTESILSILNTHLPTITFKEFISKIPRANKDMYFGNTSGYDSLKGLDINVVGTPHINNVRYKLISMVMGIQLKPLDFEMSFRKIEWGNFRFKFNCYNHPELMNIQLSLIESELIQAVGRNRTLREDCTAFVYSNLPLSISTEIRY